MTVSFRKWILLVPALVVLSRGGLVQADPPRSVAYGGKSYSATPVLLAVSPASFTTTEGVGSFAGGSCASGSCGTGFFSGGGCKFHCQHKHCPPAYKHCMEGPPRLHFKRGCPAPVCPPDCKTPNYGYYQPCWNPWPWPPDWSHCPVPTPASMIMPGHDIIEVPMTNPSLLPPPRKKNL